MKVREAIELIEDHGWFLVRTRGSHRQYKHAEKPGLVTMAGEPSTARKTVSSNRQGQNESVSRHHRANKHRIVGLFARFAWVCGNWSSSPYALRNDLTNGELYSIPITPKPKVNGALFSIAGRCSSFVSIAVATGQTESALR